MKKSKSRRTYRDTKEHRYSKKEMLMKYVRENAERGEMVTSLYNVFNEDIGFVTFKAAEIHVMDGKGMEEEEKKVFLQEIKDAIEEEKAKRKPIKGGTK